MVVPRYVGNPRCHGQVAVKRLEELSCWSKFDEVVDSKYFRQQYVCSRLSALTEHNVSHIMADQKCSLLVSFCLRFQVSFKPTAVTSGGSC